MDERSSQWLPGLLAGRHLAVNGAVCTLDYGEIYPQGVLAQISIRFRGPEQSKGPDQARQQMQAAAKNSPISGPRLILKQPGAVNSYGTIRRFNDDGGFWTLAYWFIHRPMPDGVVLHLIWSERGIDVTYVIPEEEIVRTLTAVESLTELPWDDQ